MISISALPACFLRFACCLPACSLLFCLVPCCSQVLNARVYDVATETPLQKAVNMSNDLSNNVFFKVTTTKRRTPLFWWLAALVLGCAICLQDNLSILSSCLASAAAAIVGVHLPVVVLRRSSFVTKYLFPCAVPPAPITPPPPTQNREKTSSRCILSSCGGRTTR